MNDRDQPFVASHDSIGDLGKSLFPTFAVNVPLPPNTSAPMPASPPAGGGRSQNAPASPPNSGRN